MSLAILKLLEKKGINAEISAGLSLGEYTALIYSKCISFEDGVELVKKKRRIYAKLTSRRRLGNGCNLRIGR